MWKALRFIVLFNYEILSSVIHCDSVTDSTWLRRDCPDWITGSTESAEPHACEAEHSTELPLVGTLASPKWGLGLLPLPGPFATRRSSFPHFEHLSDNPFCVPFICWGNLKWWQLLPASAHCGVAWAYTRPRVGTNTASPQLRHTVEPDTHPFIEGLP